MLVPKIRNKARGNETMIKMILKLPWFKSKIAILLIDNKDLLYYPQYYGVKGLRNK